MKKLFIAISFISLVMTSCSSDPGDILQPEERVEILPTTNITVIEHMKPTRNGGIQNPGSAIGISIFRADETYASVWTGVTALAATVETNGNITFTTPQYYLPDGSSTKLIGVYPETGTWSATNGTVTYAINGATDMMATSFAESAKGESQPALSFQHLLTQIQVTVIADSQEAIELWGTVNSVSLTDRPNNCVVQLPMPNTNTAPGTTFSGSAELAVCKSDGTPVSPLTVTETEQIFGYCMFDPITTNALLPLNVTTSLGGTVSVNVPENVYAAGTAYKVQLKLTVKGIFPTATVNEWTHDGSTTIVEL